MARNKHKLIVICDPMPTVAELGAVVPLKFSISANSFWFSDPEDCTTYKAAVEAAFPGATCEVIAPELLEPIEEDKAVVDVVETFDPTEPEPDEGE